jgi:hypothetical protein
VGDIHIVLCLSVEIFTPTAMPWCTGHGALLALLTQKLIVMAYDIGDTGGKDLAVLRIGVLMISQWYVV